MVHLFSSYGFPCHDTYICVCVCVYVCIYIYIYIYRLNTIESSKYVVWRKIKEIASNIYIINNVIFFSLFSFFLSIHNMHWNERVVSVQPPQYFYLRSVCNISTCRNLIEYITKINWNRIEFYTLPDYRLQEHFISYHILK